MVDLEGAKTGETPNLDTVRTVAAQSGLQVEIGGGIRSEEVIKKYLDAGVLRVILGTAAITQPGFVGEMVAKYGDKIAVGVDVRDGFVAIKGWTELSDRTCFDFCRDMDSLGVKTIICTDISKGRCSGRHQPGIVQTAFGNLIPRYRGFRRRQLSERHRRPPKNGPVWGNSRQSRLHGGH